MAAPGCAPELPSGNPGEWPMARAHAGWVPKDWDAGKPDGVSLPWCCVRPSQELRGSRFLESNLSFTAGIDSVPWHICTSSGLSVCWPKCSHPRREEEGNGAAEHICINKMYCHTNIQFDTFIIVAAWASAVSDSNISLSFSDYLDPNHYQYPSHYDWTSF